jgi:hypothetical protein
MTADYTIKRGDTKVALKAILERNGTPVDLTGATVLFYMRAKSGGAMKVDGGSVYSPDPTTGEVWYVWEDADVATVGDYLGEFRVTHADGRFETFPSQSYVSIEIKNGARR